MLNPEKYVRIAYLQAIATQTAVPVWTKKVPKDVTVPKKYILITSQEKQRTEVGKDCWEWLCQITIDVVFQGTLGYSDTDQVDDIEEKIITAIEAGIDVPGFMVKSIDLVDTVNLDSDTENQSIERRVIIYQHWLCQV